MRCAMPRREPGIADKKIRTAMRKHLQPKVRAVRKQLKQQISQASPKEAEQLAALDDYASGMLTALNTERLQPFTYAAVGAAQALDDVPANLGPLSKNAEPSARIRLSSWHASRASAPA